MKPKAPFKMAVDVLMTCGLLFLMGYQFWGEAAHEWVGAGMFLLFIVHHILNIGWYKNLFHGKYSPIRVLGLLVDLFLFLAMVGLMVSGIMLSQQVFSFLNLHGGMSFARLLHMAASYWGFMLMALHLGMHWGMLMGRIQRVRRRERPSRMRKILFSILGVGIAVYGLVVFIQRDLLTYMLVRTQFVFLDFQESIPRFYLDYLAMMGTFIFLADTVFRLLRRLSRKSARSQKTRNS